MRLLSLLLLGACGEKQPTAEDTTKTSAGTVKELALAEETTDPVEANEAARRQSVTLNSVAGGGGSPRNY